MKNLTLGLSLIFTSASFMACNSHDAAIPKQDSLAKNRNLSLAGQLYFFAPEYDSTHFVATGACDCCSANTVFLDDSVFLYIDYCDEGCSYIRGVYHMRNGELDMDFDSLAVEKSYAEPDVKDSTGNMSPDLTYQTIASKNNNLIYKKQEYKGRTVFTAKNNFGAIDTGETASEMMQRVKAEGIWDRLTGKTKVVNQHSPAAVMPDLQGVWAGTGDQNASFEIFEGAIYYPDGSKYYGYSVQRDSMKIKYDDYIAAFGISMKGTDTLIFDGPERQVFHRFKN
jgi:hypothetical protein